MKGSNVRRLAVLSILAVAGLLGQAAAQSDPPAIRYFRTGARYVQAGDHEMAAKAFRASVRSDPQFAEAWALLGATLFDLDYWEEAEKCLLKAAELKPEIGADPDVKQMLALLGATRRPEEGVGGDAKWYFGLGAGYAAQGEVKKAIGAFFAAVRIDPEHAEAWVGLGLGLIDQGDQQYGLECLRRGLAIRPELAGDGAVKLALAAPDQKPTGPRIQ